MARLGGLLLVLTLQLAQSLFQPAMARSCSQVSARPLAVRSRMIFNLAGEEVNGYRELGLPEDATYDKVMDAFMELSEQYRDDPERILVSPRPCTHIATSSPPSPPPRRGTALDRRSAPSARAFSDARAGKEQGARRAA